MSDSADCIFGSSEESLLDHFDKHVLKRNEFGNITLEEYLDLSFKALLEKPSSNILIKYSKNSKTVRKFNVAEGTLISYQGGKILTYFKPNPIYNGGLSPTDYWNLPQNGKDIILKY